MLRGIVNQGGDFGMDISGGGIDMVNMGASGFDMVGGMGMGTSGFDMGGMGGGMMDMGGGGFDMGGGGFDMGF